MSETTTNWPEGVSRADAYDLAEYMTDDGIVPEELVVRAAWQIYSSRSRDRSIAALRALIRSTEEDLAYALADQPVRQSTIAELQGNIAVYQQQLLGLTS